MSKKICFITGSRADYGIMKNLMRKFKNDSDIELQIIATGTHLSHDFGYTINEIIEDGFKVDEEIDILLMSDDSISICKSMGLGNILFSEALNRLSPDIIVLLGDRYEIFVAASVALVMNIPVAHIHGGEETKGSIDDSFRHSITKMSKLHFVTTNEYRDRVIRLGENPDSVFNYGSLGVENIHNMEFLSREEIYDILKLDKNKEVIILTYHSETASLNDRYDDLYKLNIILEVLNEFNDYNIVITKSNADVNGKKINKLIEEYGSRNKNVYVFDSLGSKKYFSLLNYSSLVIGNSSSGIIEVPSFSIPTINIGKRQEGRAFDESVIHTTFNSEEIMKSIKKELLEKNKYENIRSIYYGNNTSNLIYNKILEFLN